ncbi:uncharacterized protein F5891DRAFT_1186089 [Suillus fuscotomentosus]|uniref:Uncharacterized protein n=1 Tax=Suillus fuscotomentosus TaxID=1912939 RepID=A0AAD4EAY9_9AGAM|nr:uncharacterized protein F5891DRAFT_1186089 [Suillus fuscotomentosus]KAG1902948.1 hypothetical protein F5891DRAFT_1186089 [Suillus fuscotomentosus]
MPATIWSTVCPIFTVVITVHLQRNTVMEKLYTITIYPKAEVPTGPIIKEESSGSLLSHGTSKADAIKVEKVAIWPVDFYVIDIANRFNLCKKAADSRHKVSQVFIKHFGVPFKASMYYDNRKVWDLEVNRALRERFTDYGHTEKGCWTTFMKKAQQPAK